MAMGTIKITVFVLYLTLFIFENIAEESDDSCSNNTLCENSTIFENPDNDDIDDVNIKELATGILKFSGSTKSTTSTTESSVNKEQDIELKRELSKIQKVLGERSHDKFCGCDLTVSS